MTLQSRNCSLRSAIFSPSFGYTRINVDLARVYLRQNQPDEAIVRADAAGRALFESF